MYNLMRNHEEEDNATTSEGESPSSLVIVLIDSGGDSNCIPFLSRISLICWFSCCRRVFSSTRNWLVSQRVDTCLVRFSFSSFSSPMYSQAAARIPPLLSPSTGPCLLGASQVSGIILPSFIIQLLILSRLLRSTSLWVARRLSSRRPCFFPASGRLLELMSRLTGGPLVCIALGVVLVARFNSDPWSRYRNTAEMERLFDLQDMYLHNGHHLSISR